MTLTYAGDGPESAVLVYSDVQKFLKRLRKKFAVRYIVCGEYGSNKGRSHWHAVLFFKGGVPLVPLDARFSWRFWPHGFSFAQAPDYGGFRYVLKYALKDQELRSWSGHLAMSKKPPLGFEFFDGLALDHVRQRLSPQSAEYCFRSVLDKEGKPKRFQLMGRMREIYVERYLAHYREVRSKDYPFSAFVEEYEDKWIAAERERTFDAGEWRRRLADKAVSYPSKPGIKRYLLRDGYEVREFSDGSGLIWKDGEAWRAENLENLGTLLERLENARERKLGFGL